jgi:hypothetical protein
MKNANQIITSLQYKPQFKKILHHKCINKLLSIILPSIRKSVKYGYINKNIFYITIAATLSKYDKDNIINTIKMVLNSKMIIESEQFFECMDINIEDVVVYVDHKPKFDFTPYSTDSHKIHYFERATGTLEINIKDEKLKQLAKSIQQIIKDQNDTTRDD